VARLTGIAAALLLGFAAPACAGVERWSAEIAEASARFGIPEDWIRRVMKAESDGRTELAGVPITSPAGAMGLMQLMPRTWLQMRDEIGLGRDPFDPHDNIIAGTAYLRAMYDRFGYPGLFAAYNAGPSRYSDHLATGSSLPAETLGYVRKIEGAGWERRQRVTAVPMSSQRPGAIFATEAAIKSTPGEARATAAGAGLFAIKR
jgi:soluble lytic murein transglycosylase-like protein